MLQTRTKIFDKTSNHTLGAQHLRAGEDQIGRGHAFRQTARQLKADHFGNEH